MNNLVDQRLYMVYQLAFGQFQLQAFRLGAAFREGSKHVFNKVGMVELSGADVDRQCQVRQLWIMGPYHQLLARRTQDQATQRQNKPRAFSQGNEFARRHQPAYRVLPADQGLGADQLPVSIHLGLVVQDKVVLVEALAQVAFQAGAGADFGLHRRVEKAQRVAAGSFGLVHGHVGTLEYLVDRTVLLGEQGDADAGRADIAAALQGVGHGERLNDLVADVFNLLAGLFRLQAQAFEHQHKLIAAETRQGVLGA